MNVQQAAANARLVRYFESRRKEFNHPKPRPGAGSYKDVHGTHPDLVDRLWNELGGVLPEDCHAVLYGSPILARRSSSIIFAFAGGTHTYAMRLPPDVRAAAMAAGATRVYQYRAYPALKIDASALDLAEIGDEWVFCHWLKGEEDWITSAYDYARSVP